MLSLIHIFYRDADHMWRVLDGSIGAEFLQDFTAQGRVGLSWYDAGARSFYARQPVRSLSDLQGKTIRCLLYTSPTLMPTNRALPTGGVMLPMHRLYTRIRPVSYTHLTASKAQRSKCGSSLPLAA